MGVLVEYNWRLHFCGIWHSVLVLRQFNLQLVTSTLSRTQWRGVISHNWNLFPCPKLDEREIPRDSKGKRLSQVTLCKIWGFHECWCWGSSPGPRPMWMVRNMIHFYSKLLAPRLTPKLEKHAMSVVCDRLFNMFGAIHNVGGRSFIRNLRTRHAAVTGTHLLWSWCCGFWIGEGGRQLWML